MLLFVSGLCAGAAIVGMWSLIVAASGRREMFGYGERMYRLGRRHGCHAGASTDTERAELLREYWGGMPVSDIKPLHQ